MLLVEFILTLVAGIFAAIVAARVGIYVDRKLGAKEQKMLVSAQGVNKKNLLNKADGNKVIFADRRRSAIGS